MFLLCRVDMCTLQILIIIIINISCVGNADATSHFLKREIITVSPHLL